MELLETIYRFIMGTFYFAFVAFVFVAICHGIVAVFDPGREWRK